MPPEHQQKTHKIQKIEKHIRHKQYTTMARKKQMARKSIGGSTIAGALARAARLRELRIQQMLDEYDWKWCYCMVRLIGIRDKIDIDGIITADKIMNKLSDMRDVYELFNQYNETEAENHIIVGVQSRRYNDDRMDAYIMIGMRIRDDEDIFYDESIATSVNDALCKMGKDIYIAEEHYCYIENDIDTFKQLSSITKEMEDIEEVGQMLVV